MNLDQNSVSMKTVVETYVIEETAELIYDSEALSKWEGLVQKLGLTGQDVLKNPKKSPIPFMWMKPNLINIFQTLCPRQTPITMYDKTPIPLEILTLVELCINENYFDQIDIWYDDKAPDPVCVGQKKYYELRKPGSWSNFLEDRRTFKSKQEAEDYIIEMNFGTLGLKVESATTKYYLLGRWADVKRTFQELAEMATTRWIKEERARYERYIRDYEKNIETLIPDAEQRFSI